jgi:CBS domain-containing protein
MTPEPNHLYQPVLTVARKDVAMLRQDLTVQQALDAIRQRGIGEKIVYFYVVDADDRLAGVLPTRRLLTAPLEQRLADLMIARVVAIPETATVMEACEAFVLHKFLAFPVVDAQRRIVGVVDAGLLTDEAFDIAEREQAEGLFESIGFHLSQVRDASPMRAFRFRFPWLLATISSGTICALLASAYEVTLAKSIVLAFFLTHSVHDRHDPGLASNAAELPLVWPGVSSGGRHRRAARRRVRHRGGSNCLAMARSRAGGHCHRREHSAGAMRRLLFRPERPGAPARPEARPEDLRRSGDTRLHRPLHPLVLLQPGRLAAVMSPGQELSTVDLERHQPILAKGLRSVQPSCRFFASPCGSHGMGPRRSTTEVTPECLRGCKEVAGKLQACCKPI